MIVDKNCYCYFSHDCCNLRLSNGEQRRFHSEHGHNPVSVIQKQTKQLLIHKSSELVIQGCFL